MFYDRLKQVCEEKGTNVTALTKKIKFSGGNISKWKNGGVPKSETLIVIAKELSISVDYLLGLDDIPNRKEKSSTLKFTNEEYELIEKFRHLLEIDKGRILGEMGEIYRNYSPEQKENVS